MKRCSGIVLFAALLVTAGGCPEKTDGPIDVWADIGADLSPFDVHFADLGPDPGGPDTPVVDPDVPDPDLGPDLLIVLDSQDDAGNDVITPDGGLDGGPPPDPGSDTVQSGGDTCADALVIDPAALPYEHSGDTSEMTDDYSSGTCGPGAYGDGLPDVVYAFTPDSTGLYAMELLHGASPSPSTFYIVTDCGDIAGSCVGGSGDVFYGGTYGVDLDEGVQYYIIVDGIYADDAGEYTFTLSACTPHCSMKECGDDGCGGNCADCTGGDVCDDDGQCVVPADLTGNTCVNPYVVGGGDLPFVHYGDTTEFTNDFSVDAGQCASGWAGALGGGSNDAFYRFTPDSDGIYVVELGFGLFDAALFLVSDCTDASTCVAAANDAGGNETLGVQLTGGQAYVVVVDGADDAGNEAGPYVLEISGPCTPDCADKQCGDDGCGGSCEPGCSPPNVCNEETWQCEEAPLGDSCVNPIVIGAIPYDGELIDSSVPPFTPLYDGSACTTGTDISPDVVFSFTAEVEGVYTFSIDDTATFDTVLYVSIDCGDIDGTCIAGDDHWPGNGGEEVEIKLGKGQTIFLIADGYDGEMGQLELTGALSCTSDCDGKTCGPDGCGYTCGTCEDGALCNETTFTCECFDSCPAEDAPRCNGTVPETCTVGADGCLDWVAGADCAGTASPNCMVVSDVAGCVVSVPISGADCDDTGVEAVDLSAGLPLAIFGQTNAGSGASYTGTCLGSFDAGEDSIYHLTVATETALMISIDPGATPGTGIALDSACPPGDTCLAASTAAAAEPHGLGCQLLAPGTYFLMVDSTAAPGSIADFSLSFDDCSCTQGELRCSSDGGSLETCNADGYTWTAQACEFGCDDSGGLAACASCADACTEGEARCDGNVVETCATGALGCLEWQLDTACADPTPWCDPGLDPPACTADADGDYCETPLVVGALPYNSGVIDTSDVDLSADYSGEGCAIESDAANDVAFLFQVPTNGVYELSIPATASFDTVLYLVGDCGDIAGTCVGGDDQAGTGGESITVKLDQDDTIYVIVDGAVGTGGEFELDVVLTCTSSCAGFECGDDGCGYSCGTCEEGFMCDGTSQLCVCDDDCAAAGEEQCSGTVIDTCTADADACLRWVPGTDCADTENYTCQADAGVASCVCDDQCTTVGETSCAGDVIRTCAVGANSCLVWEAGEDCAATPNYACQEDAGGASCVCVPQCPSVGATSCLGSLLRTCVADAEGCLDWDAGSDCALTADPYCVELPGGAQCASSPSPGDDCDDTVFVPVQLPGMFPLELSGQTNCGSGDNYSTTCLGSYDGGDDVIYTLDVTSDVAVEIALDAGPTTFTGIAIDDACPLGSSCIDSSTNGSAGIHGLSCQLLTAGTYYIMVDTYPSPACVPDFTLHFTDCSCVEGETRCAGADVLETCSADSVTWTPSTCEFGCDDTGPVAQCVPCIDTCTLGETRCFGAQLQECQQQLCLEYVTTQDCWSSGEFCDDSTGTPQCTPTPPAAAPGQSCVDPLLQPIQIPDVFSNGPYLADMLNNCGAGDDYSGTCLGDYDDGDDMILELSVAKASPVIITLDPKGTSYTGITLDGVCPPSNSCAAESTSSSSSAHSLPCTMLEQGNHFLMVDTWPSPNCIPDFSVGIEDCSCVVGTTECVDTNTLTTCDADGYSWVEETCLYGCDVTGGTAQCALCADQCALGEQTCLPDGIADCGMGSLGCLEWQLTTPCEGATPYCDPTQTPPVCVDTQLIPTPGADCNDAGMIPIVGPAQLPWFASGQSNCGLGDAYSSTCLNSYDGGEDIIYELQLTSDTVVEINFDPGGTTWAGVALADSCPPGASCIDTATGSSASLKTLACQPLAAGTYYIMVDTYPSPDCVPDFSLSVIDCNCTPGETQCADADTLETCGTDSLWSISETCDYGCDASSGTAQCAICADACVENDQTCFASSIHTCVMGALGCTEWQLTTPCEGATPYCDPIPDPPVCVDTPVNPVPGADCDDPDIIPVILPDQLPFFTSGQSNCGLGDSYDQTCLSLYDGGDDMIFELQLATAMTLEFTFDSGSTTYAGIAVDDSCPLDGTSCVASSTSSSSGVQTLGCQLYPAGTYYVMVDTWPSPDCVPDFSLAITDCNCNEGETQCADPYTLETCGADKLWSISETCEFGCDASSGTAQCAICADECADGEQRCFGSIIQTCGYGVLGCLEWQDTTQCEGATPYCDDATGTPTCTDVAPTPASGVSCTDPDMIPILVPEQLPFSSTGESTCGAGDTLENTCLDLYDGGEDRFFELTVTEDTGIEITMVPTNTYSGIALDDSCPLDGDTCIATQTAGSSTSPQVIECTYVPAGIHYLMVDTWPSPDCTGFDLDIQTCTPCIPDCNLSPSSFNMMNWTVSQTDAAFTTVMPAGLQVAPGEYVVIGRNASQGAFETHWGLTLGANVHYVDAGDGGAPQLDGAEIVTLRDAAAALIDGPSYAFTGPNANHQRVSGALAADAAASWTIGIVGDATPGTGGVDAGTGPYLNEITDAVDKDFQFIEIYAPVIATGEACGFDGCGEICSYCDAGFSCDFPTGECVAPGDASGNTCDPMLVVDNTSFPVSTLGETTGMTDDMQWNDGECNSSTGASTGGQDVTYRFTAPAAGNYTFTAYVDWDVVIYATTTCGDMATCIGAADDAYLGDETMTLTLTDGQTVYVTIDGYDTGDDGVYEFVVEQL